MAGERECGEGPKGEQQMLDDDWRMVNGRRQTALNRHVWLHHRPNNVRVANSTFHGLNSLGLESKGALKVGQLSGTDPCAKKTFYAHRDDELEVERLSGCICIW